VLMNADFPPPRFFTAKFTFGHDSWILAEDIRRIKLEKFPISTTIPTRRQRTEDGGQRLDDR